MKKKASKKQQKKVSSSKISSTVNLNDQFSFPEYVYWGLTATFVLVYYLFSTQSVGFYQQDEAAHFINMQDFWVNPKTILGIWAKPGFKLVYILPSLLGAKGVLLTNCLFAALAAYFTGLAAKSFGLKDRMMVMLLCAFLPMLYQISFRNYSELVTAFLLAVMIYLYQEKRWVLAALAASYLFALRQEMALVGICMGALFLYRRQIKPIIALAAAPIILNLIGAVVTGDPLFLLSQLSGGAGDYKELGFFHLWNMFTPSVGTVTTLLFLIGLLGFFVWDKGVLDYLKKYEIIYISFVPVFLFWCLVTAPQFTLIKLGANLRQITSLTPAIVLFAAMGLDLIRRNGQKKTFFAIGVTAVLGLLIISFFSYDYNHFIYTNVADNTKIFVLLISAGLLFGLPKLGVSFKIIGLALGIIATLHTLFIEPPIPLALEDAAMKEMADFVLNNKLDDREKIVSTHTMFNYYMGNNAWERQTKYTALPQLEDLDKLPKGSLIVWESHYSQRRTKISLEFFQNNPKYKALTQKLTADKRFMAVILEKQ